LRVGERGGGRDGDWGGIPVGRETRGVGKKASRVGKGGQGDLLAGVRRSRGGVGDGSA